MPFLFTSLFSGGTGGAPPVRTFFQTFFEPAENSPFETGFGLTAQVASVNRRTFLSWDVPGEHADVEVLARITTDKPSVARMGILLRGGGSAGAETGWFVQRARADERFEIGRYDGGAYTLNLRRTAERAGRAAKKLNRLERTHAIHQDMLDAAARRPRSRDDLLDRVREGRF